MLIILNKNHIFNELNRVLNIEKKHKHDVAESGSKIARLLIRLAKCNGITVPELCTKVGIELPMPAAPTIEQQRVIIEKIACYE